MKKFSVIVLLILSLNLSAIAAEESTIAFMRSSSVGSLIKTSIYDVTDGQIKFLGIMKNKTRIDYKLPPGKYTFMVVAEAADFMQAEITSGKTYYSLITPRMGVWKARFSIIPVRSDGATDFKHDKKKFNKILKKVKLVEIDDKARKWYQKHKNSVAKKKVKYWTKWQEKSATDTAARTMRPEDGT